MAPLDRRPGRRGLPARRGRRAGARSGSATTPPNGRGSATSTSGCSDGWSGVHLSLAITGGAADAAGTETILAAPYASLAVDLIAGPDNWRLVRAAPRERGIVCGRPRAAEGSDDAKELLVWAAELCARAAAAASSASGLATASSLAALPWASAVRKLARIAEAVRITDLPPAERLAALDPRAVDIRSAALGRYDPAARRAARDPDPRPA